MASGRGEWSCPICCEVPRDIAHTLPCCHKFCLGCIMRWLRRKLTCPLCRRLVSTVRFSERDEDCLQFIIRYPREATSHAADRDGHSTPAEQGAAGPEAVGGILPELWAELFRRRPNLLNPVRSYLQQWLQQIHSDQWWKAKAAESTVLLALCTFGPDREVLVQRLQRCLKHYTALLVHGILSIIETQCSQEVQQLRGCHTAQEEAESPRDSSGPSATPGDAPVSAGPPDSSVEHEAGTSEEAPEGSPSTCGTVPSETEQS